MPINAGDPSSMLLQTLQDITGMFDRQRQEGDTPPPEITTKRTPDGTFHTVDNLSDQDMRKIMDVLNSQAKIVDAYQREIGKIEQQQRSMNPILNVLATVGGNLAMADKRLPPVVQALGQSARELNPTDIELSNRKLGIMHQLVGIEGQQAELGLEVARERRMGLHEQLEFDQQRMNRINTAANAVLENAGRGEKPAKNAVIDRVVRAGGDPKFAQQVYDEAVSAYNAAVQGEQEKTKRTKEAQIEAETDPRVKKSKLELAAAEAETRERIKRKYEDKDIEETAKALVEAAKPGSNDIATMRDVAGFGVAKYKLYSAARRYAAATGQKFSSQELERKAEMQKDVATGQMSLQHQSLDTFLQHAGEAQAQTKKITPLISPVLSKTMKEVKTKLTGDPEFAKFSASLEPVAIEYERFLKSQGRQYALTDNDTKRIHDLVDDSKTVKQVLAVLDQMAITVKARTVSMNNRYKDVMQRDLWDDYPLSQEATEAGQRLGVTIGSGNQDRLGILK